MMYIGSTMDPMSRFNNHLLTGRFSNTGLQQAIKQHGLSEFAVYILEEVAIPAGYNPVEAVEFLRATEDRYVRKYPKAQL